jgi:hypothetical protein
MKPTPQLRYVEREVWMPLEYRDDVHVKRAIRILQQWWVATELSDVSEWRDVPIEKE